MSSLQESAFQSLSMLHAPGVVWQNWWTKSSDKATFSQKTVSFLVQIGNCGLIVQIADLAVFKLSSKNDGLLSCPSLNLFIALIHRSHESYSEKRQLVKRGQKYVERYHPKDLEHYSGTTFKFSYQ